MPTLNFYSGIIRRGIKRNQLARQVLVDRERIAFQWKSSWAGMVQIMERDKGARGESQSFESAGAITSSSSRCKFHWDWLSIDYSLLLRVFFIPLPFSHHTLCPSLEYLSFSRCTYTIRTDRRREGYPVSSLSFAFSRKIDPVPSSLLPLFWHFFPLPLTMGGGSFTAESLAIRSHPRN